MPPSPDNIRLLLFDVGGVLVELKGVAVILDWLKNSITTRVVKSDSDSVTVHVGPSDVEYGRIQELGGVIKPVKAKRLHWVDEEGRHLSALAVTIPARPYLRPAVDDNVSEITGAVGENLRIEIEGAV